jgi:hypothetical protein
VHIPKLKKKRRIAFAQWSRGSGFSEQISNPTLILACAPPICANAARKRCYIYLRRLVHIPKFRNGTGKILANASMPDFSGASDIILGYALGFVASITLAKGEITCMISAT